MILRMLTNATALMMRLQGLRADPEAQSNSTMVKEVYIGIDLGTTNSAVCIFDPKTQSYEFQTYDLPHQLTMPSIVYAHRKLNEKDEPVFDIGYKALLTNQTDPDEENFFFRYKPLIGLSELSGVNEHLNEFLVKSTYKIERKMNNGKGYYAFPCKFERKDGKMIDFDMTPTYLSSLILNNLRFRIENERKYKIKGVCITTPIYFSSNQDDEVREAAKNAGLNNVIIQKEPVAACTSYMQDKNIKMGVEAKVLVFDFGGGTLDISILEVVKELDESNNVSSSVVPVAHKGDIFLGGENINDKLFEYVESNVIGNFKLQALDRLRLRLFIEDFKIALCNKQKNFTGDAEHTDIFTAKDGDKDKEFTLTMTTSKFNKIVDDVFENIKSLFYESNDGLFKDDAENRKAGRMDEVVADSIESVILVGGSTRIPHIKTLLKQLCPKAIFYDQIETDLAVAQGACVICVNSDPSSGMSDLHLVNIVPLPIGIKVHDGSFQEIIEKDLTIPTSKEMIFTTVYDNQTKIIIEVAMGVRPMFDHNEKLGHLTLTLTRPMPKGEPQIKVGIIYNADYSFEVTAKEGNNFEKITFDSKVGRPDPKIIKSLLDSASENFEKDIQIKQKFEKLKTFDAALDLFESKLKSSNLSDDEKAYFDVIVDGNREWRKTSAPGADLPMVDAKLDSLKSSVESLDAAITEASRKPATTEKPAEATRDVL